MPDAVSNVPRPVLVLNTTRSAASRAVGETSSTLPVAANSPVRDVPFRSSAKICCPALGPTPMTSTSSHEPHAVGVEPLDRELLGVPAGNDLRRRRGRRREQEQQRARTAARAARKRSIRLRQGYRTGGDEPRAQRTDERRSSRRRPHARACDSASADGASGSDAESAPRCRPASGANAPGKDVCVQRALRRRPASPRTARRRAPARARCRRRPCLS